MGESGFLPAVLAARLLRRWLCVLVLAVIGAAAGWVVSELRSPVYAATAVLGIGIDYGRTLPLDDRAEQIAMDRVRALLLADDTLEATLAALRGSGLSSAPTAGTLRERIRLEDKRSEWHLAAYGESPEMAATVANAWAAAALGILDQATRHAWRAAELQQEVYGLGCTLVPSPGEGRPPAWRCEVSQAEPNSEALLGQLLEETRLSRGVLPSLSFSLLREAEPPAGPVIGGRGWLILAGLAIGGLIGILAAAGTWPRHIRQQGRRQRGSC